MGYAPFVPHPVRRRCWRFTPTKADPCLGFLIDLVRSLRTTVRLPSGHVRLQSGLVRLPSRLVRFFLVALAADARADGPASARKGVHCKGNHGKQPGLFCYEFGASAPAIASWIKDLISVIVSSTPSRRRNATQALSFSDPFRPDRRHPGLFDSHCLVRFWAILFRT